MITGNTDQLRIKVTTEAFSQNVQKSCSTIIGKYEKLVSFTTVPVHPSHCDATIISNMGDSKNSGVLGNAVNMHYFNVAMFECRGQVGEKGVHWGRKYGHASPTLVIPLPSLNAFFNLDQQAMYCKALAGISAQFHSPLGKGSEILTMSPLDFAKAMWLFQDANHTSTYADSIRTLVNFITL